MNTDISAPSDSGCQNTGLVDLCENTKNSESVAGEKKPTQNEVTVEDDHKTTSKSDIPVPQCTSREAVTQKNEAWSYKRGTIVSPMVETSKDIIFMKDDTIAKKKCCTKQKYLLEKCVFLISVTSLVLWAYGLFNYHWLLPYYYTVVLPLLVAIRVWIYWTKKWQWFLLDFCYFANAMTMIYIWVIPNHEFMFMLVFALANGPLIWAILIYRNSLVFHSLDKMTSVFIHLLPAYLSFGLRWYPESISLHWYRPFVIDPPPPDFIWLVVVPLSCIVFHGLVYLILVHLLIKPSEDYLDSYRYFISDQNSIYFKAVSIFGKK
uniref:Glycerophosphocholine acyltransferase 1 n=1 Tax=Saccoglossus kowalevskii TaxID=10224 RepID=A0ABM0M6D0_SACKO|nr:PREDICTED: uncharacterized protein LOC102805840 [Saccoglossus kowalevskii]